MIDLLPYIKRQYDIDPCEFQTVHCWPLHACMLRSCTLSYPFIACLLSSLSGGAIVRFKGLVRYNVDLCRDVTSCLRFYKYIMYTKE